MSRVIVMLWCVGLVLLAGGVCADELYTRDGRKLVGQLTETADHWIVKMSFGTVKVKKDNVLKIVRKMTGADKYAQKKQEIDPQDADGWFRLASWCQTQKLSRWAKTAARKTLELDSEHAGAHQIFGRVKVGDRWVDQKAAARLRADMQAVEMRAKGRVRLGNRWVTQAVYKASFRRAVEQFNQGNQLLRLKQDRKAVTQYEAALESFPDFSLARMRLALAWMHLKQGARAIGILRKMAIKNPQSATIQFNLALAYQSLKRYSEAFRAYKKALEINPRRRDAMHGILSLAKFLKRKKAIAEYEVMRAEQLKETLVGLSTRQMPDGYDLTITLQDRPIQFTKRKLERQRSGGVKPVQVVTRGKQTPLRDTKARAYRYKVAEPLALDSATFIKLNTRLRKMATYPVFIDDFRKGGWAFEFRSSQLIRLKIMRFLLEQDGKRVTPAGTLRIRYLTYRRVEYRGGRVVDGVTQVNLTLWREFKAEDWPEEGFLALPACVADAVEIEFKLADGSLIKEASVYDHDHGIVRKIPAADWQRAAAAKAKVPAVARFRRDARGRAAKLFEELQRRMAGFKASGTDPKAAAVRSWTESWQQRVNRLAGETVDPDVKLALEDMDTLRALQEGELGGKQQAARIAFFITEIKQQLQIK